ncbi:hypothetical protein D9619_006867 [Psilocybe cf. subviscida]|uniref:Uncharacterized protein n=1 Tax=Psilocybe cf. subviscida TaxID=2480587 RepID=A0A8H5B535_9AGAR|nr:hypothetical protein D9619_006867 [Psilocybe cf. subviscida]
MSQQSTDTDADTASVLSASSAASYHRKKKAKEQPSIHHFQVPMSSSDYSDFSRYPRFTNKTVEPEGPGVRMRGNTSYDDDALPPGYNPVTTTSTYRENERPHRSHRHRRSSSSTSPRVQHEIRAVPDPAAPGGVTPHVVTHVHLSSPRRSRRHRSVSREPPPVASRPAYGRRRSRSYDDSYRSQTHIINLPPPPVAPNPGYMYGQPQPLPPLQPLPASPEFGYGRPTAPPGGYGGTAGNRAGSLYPSSRRRAMSNVYQPSPASSRSPYGGASSMGMGGQYSPYGANSSTPPNISVISPSAPSTPYSASGYGASASQRYPSQSGYGAPTGSNATPVVVNIPSGGSIMGQQPIMAGSRRARATSMNGMGYGMNGMPAPHMGGAYGGGRHGMGGPGGNVYAEGNPYGAGNIGYGQSANGVYGYGPGQARDPTPGGRLPSPPPSQRPPGTGFFGGLFGRKSPKSDTSDNDDPYAQNQDYGRPRRGRHHN